MRLWRSWARPRSPRKASADGGTSDHDVSIQISDEDLIGDEDWLSDEDLIGDILRIGDAAPATSGGGHINHITRRIGPFFVYAAFDQYGHPVRNCKRMDYLPHYNINVKRNSDDPDNLSMLRFHVTPADQNKRVILYESKTKTCVDISKRNLKERIKKLTKQGPEGYG